MISWTKLLFAKESFGDTLRYSPSRKHLKPVVVWNITPYCNLKCCHCYLDSSEPPPQTTQPGDARARKLIRDLSEFGVPVILFSGGEPLLRKDIFELGEFARKCNIRPVLSTNGTLITPSVAGRIKDSGFAYVGISIDGNESTHDRIRGAKGSFSASIEGIRNCQDAGIKAGLRFTLMRENFRDLTSVFELVEKEGIKRLCIYHLVYSGRARRREDDLSLSEKREALELIFENAVGLDEKNRDVEILTVGNHADGVWLYLKLRRTDPRRAEGVLRLLEMNGGNASGKSIAAIDHLGNVFPDQFWQTHCLGNAYETSFAGIWQGETGPFLSTLRNRRQFIKGRCGECGFFSLCNGNMRARAEAVFGDPWAEDPACYLTDKEIHGTDETYSAVNRTGTDA